MQIKLRLTCIVFAVDDKNDDYSVDDEGADKDVNDTNEDDHEIPDADRVLFVVIKLWLNNLLDDDDDCILYVDKDDNDDNNER